MTIYMGAIVLTELLMLTMSLHVLHYPGFTRAEKHWYLYTFIAIFFCAGAEFDPSLAQVFLKHREQFADMFSENDNSV